MRGLEPAIQRMLQAKGDPYTVVSFDGTRYRGDTDPKHGRVCLVGGERKGRDHCYFTITDGGRVRYHCFEGVAHPRCASVEIGSIGTASQPARIPSGGPRSVARPGNPPVLPCKPTPPDTKLPECGRGDALGGGTERWTGELPPCRHLMDAKHTKRLIMGNPSGMASLARTVRRIRDPWIRRFFPLLVTEWLPVERRLCYRDFDGRGDGCKLCCAPRESVRHVYACKHPTVRGEVVACRARAVDLLRGEGVRVVVTIPAGLPQEPGRTGVSAPVNTETPVRPPRTTEDSVRWVPLWFDTSGTHWMGVDPEARTTNSCDRDGLADVIGVIPCGVTAQLESKCSGSDWSRRPPGAACELVARIRIELVYGALRTWLARCRAMDEWWSSPAAATHRAQRIRTRAARRLAWRRKSDAALLAKWELKRAEKALKRKRKRVRVERGSTIAARLSRKRVQVDPGFCVTGGMKTAEEYEEELMRRCQTGERFDRLPWF